MPSPHPIAAGLLPSPHSASGGGGVARPPLMKRHSSQQSHASSKHTVLSPSSAGEHVQQPLRHHVKTARKTKIVLPRNNSSARNLAKLARHGSDTPKHARQKSHEEEGIRLPGSLDESRPAMKRNLTSSHLPRNTSHTKLKKNLSHGQLARIGSGRNLQGLNHTKGPPSPGLKGKSRKKRSLDATFPEKDLHEQEVELAQQQQQQQAAKEGPRRVGFAVGDGNDSSEDDDGLEMEGSGLQEDEWTDQSASASPATTRQNTANNSRRPSLTVAEKPHEQSSLREAVNARDVQMPHYQQRQRPAQQPPRVQFSTQQRPAPEADGTPAASYESDSDDEEDEGDEDDPPSPRSLPQIHKVKNAQLPDRSVSAQPQTPSSSQPTPASTPKSLLHGAKDHPNSFTKQLLNRSTHNPAPALFSNVSAMDQTRSARASPAASMRSSRSNIADQTPDQEGELVSRFIPSTSHPTTGSGGNTTLNTPKIGSYQTPEGESTLAAQHRDKPIATAHPPTSPVSTISASSGAATPAMLRSRTELRMANERAMAELEGSGRPQLSIPAHKFDRRNESLKSYLHDALSGGLPKDPSNYTGRFTAVNTELKVIQRFCDPLGDSLARLSKGEGVRFRQLRARRPQQRKAAGKVAISSSSAVGLSSSQVGKLSSSGSPPAKSASPAKSALLTSRSAVNVGRGGHGSGSGGPPRVKFTTSPPETRDVERVVGGGEEEDLTGADAIARQLWDAASGGV